MKYLNIILIIILNAASSSGYAQNQDSKPDTMLHVSMKAVHINGKRNWANDTIRYNYNQTKYYITTILPYLNETIAMHQEMQTKIATHGWSKKRKKRYLKTKENELRQKFDAEIKQLNETQGVLLVKLISRQTGENLYHMLLDYKSRLAATKWLGWAALHGFNLNKQYDPNDEPMLENIMESLDYPLPELYYNRNLSAN